jgi:hypothetical protein
MPRRPVATDIAHELIKTELGRKTYSFSVTDHSARGGIETILRVKDFSNRPWHGTPSGEAELSAWEVFPSRPGRPPLQLPVAAISVTGPVTRCHPEMHAASIQRPPREVAPILAQRAESTPRAGQFRGFTHFTLGNLAKSVSLEQISP